jgi:hypothetical protein
MCQPATQDITPEVVREVCIRTGSKATVLGSIPNLGGQYVIGLNATGCGSGDTLGQRTSASDGQAGVLKTLGKAAKALRGKLSKSLATVEKFDVSVEATTPSLEALAAYSMGAIRHAGRATRKRFPSISVRLNSIRILPWRTLH